MKMTDIKIHTDALLHTKCNGEIVHITVGSYKHNICANCGKVTETKLEVQTNETKNI
jgi:hypothetical protein